jgi:raffinose/stachyose/melibiose transport system permease protein
VLWTLPALIFYVAFAIIPLFIALYYSFTSWNGLAPAVWIGLGNWRALFSDHVTLTSLPDDPGHGDQLDRTNSH